VKPQAAILSQWHGWLNGYVVAFSGGQGGSPLI